MSQCPTTEGLILWILRKKATWNLGSLKCNFVTKLRVCLFVSVWALGHQISALCTYWVLYNQRFQKGLCWLFSTVDTYSSSWELVHQVALQSQNYFWHTGDAWLPFFLLFLLLFFSGSNSGYDRPEIWFIQGMTDRKYDSYQYLEMHFQRCTTQVSKFGILVSLTGSEHGRLHKEPCFHFRLWGVCNVALNRPPTQNGDHINPPDISADGNTNVYFWWGKKQTANKILFFVKESGQALPWIWIKTVTESWMPTDPAAFKVVTLAFTDSINSFYISKHQILKNIHKAICISRSQLCICIKIYFPEKEIAAILSCFPVNVFSI